MAINTSLGTSSAATVMPSTSKARYQFGEFVFDSNQDELVFAATGQSEKLEPKVAELLCLFITHAGQVLDKDTLQAQLWPNTVVEQNSLYQLLTKLRRTLGCPPKQPKYIKTLPKKGYCFIADVTTVTPDALPATKLFANEPRQTKPSTPTAPTLWASKNKWLFFLPLFIVGFSAIAWFKRDKDSYVTPSYTLSEVSYDLGLEFEVDAHPQEALLAYIKDIFTLQITDKQGQPLFSKTFSERVAKPAWHEQNKVLAFWRYDQDLCELNIISAFGAISHTSSGFACTDVLKPVWLSADELLLTLKQDNLFVPYHYRIGTKTLAPLPVIKKVDEKIKGVTKGFNDELLLILVDAKYQSRLVNRHGDTLLTWPFPVYLVGFNPKTGAILTNNEETHSGILASHLDGQRYLVSSTAQGLYTSLSADLHGDIYTSLESWQVNIRDKDDLPIFSTSSIDYLPVSNPLGETAFMSRRSGVCEVYLHSEGRIQQLSHHQGFDYVSFLEWRPDHTMLLSNRDNDVVIYDRKSTLSQFSTALTQTMRSLGWLSNDLFYTYDGKTVLVYNLQGQLIDDITLAVTNLFYAQAQQTWIIQDGATLYQLAELKHWNEQSHKAAAKPLAALTAQQANQIHNFRVRDNTLYWQSSWSKQDYIWSIDLLEQGEIALIKSGNLIWQFDVDAYHRLSIAKMESLEGNIKRLSLAN